MPKPGKPGFGGDMDFSSIAPREKTGRPGLRRAFFRFGRKRGASEGLIAPCVHGAPFDRLRHAAAMSLRL